MMERPVQRLFTMRTRQQRHNNKEAGSKALKEEGIVKEATVGVCRKLATAALEVESTEICCGFQVTSQVCNMLMMWCLLLFLGSLFRNRRKVSQSALLSITEFLFDLIQFLS